jgi:hypothetical protein
VHALRLTLLGVGAMRSPRYAPAGLLVSYGRTRVMIDAGPDTDCSQAEAWLVTDDRAELIAGIRRRARTHGLEPRVATFRHDDLAIRPRRVVHTAHPTFGYRITAAGRTAVWAPEFWTFPTWARGADLLFAEAAGWNRPIHFARGVGGHLCALDVARAAQRAGVGRLVLAHIGRPSIRARDRGERLPFGEWGDDGRTYVLRAGSATRG